MIELAVKPGTDVVDIAAETGQFSWLIARKAGDTGTVCAIDVSKEFTDNIDRIVSA